jgi:hypothetical protein
MPTGPTDLQPDMDRLQKVLAAARKKYPNWASEPVSFGRALRNSLIEQGFAEEVVNDIIDSVTGYDGSTTDMMLLADLGPRRATTSQLRRIIEQGMQKGFNRRIRDREDIPLLPADGVHTLVPIVVHRYIEQQPAEQHIRCRVVMQTSTSSKSREVILDVVQKTLERLPRLKPRRSPKPDPTWEQVLEWYVELYEQTKSNPAFVDFDLGDGVKHDTVVPLELLREQDPWFVSEDMVTLCEHAADGMPSHELAVSELVTNAGFMILERPIYVDSLNWGLVPVRALVWKLVGPGTQILGWPNSRSDRPVVACMAFMDLDHEDTPPDPVNAPGYRSRLWPVLHWLWPEGEPVDAVYNWNNLTDDTVRQAFMQLRKYFMATWLLSGQRIAGVTGQKPARGLRRRAERAKLPSTVLVVRLRRETGRQYDDDHESNEVEWSHRWLVNGHWRRIWDKKEQRVRLIWVSPYIKGPENKPLILKDRIYKFER